MRVRTHIFFFEKGIDMAEETKWEARDDMDNIVYKYEKTYEDYEDAKSLANYFHNCLCGNYDYRDSNILLNWSGNTVLLAEFEGSKTHVHVNEELEEHPVLELFIEPEKDISDAEE